MTVGSSWGRRRTFLYVVLEVVLTWASVAIASGRSVLLGFIGSDPGTPGKSRPDGLMKSGSNRSQKASLGFAQHLPSSGPSSSLDRLAARVAPGRPPCPQVVFVCVYIVEGEKPEGRARGYENVSVMLSTSAWNSR